jgi:hypothetical protein
VVCALGVAPPHFVLAQAVPDDGTRAAARELGRQGIDAYLEGKFEDAKQRLEKAYRLFATPTLGLWSARARLHCGQWVEAAERFRETLRLSASVGDSAMQQSALREAAVELEALLPRLAAVTIVLRDGDAAGVQLSLDGARLSNDMLGVRRPMNPGAHRVVATRGAERGGAQFVLAEAEHKVVQLSLSTAVINSEAVPAPKPSAMVVVAPAAASVVSPMAQPLAAAERGGPDVEPGAFPLRPLGIATFAVGGVALVASGVTALMAEGQCAGGRCADTMAQDKYDPLRMVSSVTFWSGAALAVGGALAWWFAPQADMEAERAVSWGVSPLGVSVAGTL